MFEFEQNDEQEFSNIFKVSKIYLKYLKYFDLDEQYSKYFRIQMGNMFKFEQNVEQYISIFWKMSKIYKKNIWNNL